MAAFPTQQLELNPRQQSILEQLEQRGRVSVTELAEDLEVSDVTIRKDLQLLEEFSLLKRVHGGAIAARRSKFNLSIAYKIRKLGPNKERIAYQALELIHDGDTLILDSGSTTLALARLLPQYKRGLTIVTNSLPIISELANVSDFELILLGGPVRKHSLATFGPLTVENLERLQADIVFLGADGASIERGLSTPNLGVAETKAAMVHAATECVALVDHSKISQTSLASFAKWRQIHTLVTDLSLADDFTQFLRESNVKVLVAEEKSYSSPAVK